MLQAYADEDGNAAKILPDTKITVEFLGGQVERKCWMQPILRCIPTNGDALTMAVGGTTMMACPEEIMAQEQAYLAALSSASTFEVSEDQLQIANAEGDIVLSLQR